MASDGVILTCKLIVLACLLFNGFCLIGMLKMGSDDFMVWLGGKLIGAWRIVRRQDGNCI